MRTFFDSYGKLCFCTDENVLLSAPTLDEITEYADGDIPDKAVSLLSEFHGTLQQLRDRLTRITVEEMIDEVALLGSSVQETMDSIEESAIFPRKRRYSGRHGINPSTGRAKNPKRSQASRKASRKNRVQRSKSSDRFNRSPQGKRFHKKLGKLNSKQARH